MALRRQSRGRRINLSDLNVTPQADQAQPMEFEVAPESAAVQRQTTLATDTITEGEVGRYARRPDNRETVAHFTNFQNRGIRSNPDLHVTGVERGAEVGQVKANAPKPQKFSMSRTSVASMVDSGVGSAPTPNLDAHIQMIVQQMLAAQAPEPTPRQSTIVQSVLQSMDIPAEAKKKIDEAPPAAKVEIVRSLTDFVPLEQPQTRTL